MSFFSKVCGTPTKTGYDFTGTTGSTYGETSFVSCAAGYEGTVSPSSVTCEATGMWTDVTGCSIKSTYNKTVGPHLKPFYLV